MILEKRRTITIKGGAQMAIVSLRAKVIERASSV